MLASGISVPRLRRMYECDVKFGAVFCVGFVWVLYQFAVCFSVSEVSVPDKASKTSGCPQFCVVFYADV